MSKTTTIMLGPAIAGCVLLGAPALQFAAAAAGLAWVYVVDRKRREARK